MQDSVIRKYKIVLEQGLHVRTATTIAKLVSGFSCKVTISKDGNEVGLDSPLSILTLGIEFGDEIFVNIEGPGCENLAGDFDKLVENNFGE